MRGRWVQRAAIAVSAATGAALLAVVPAAAQAPAVDEVLLLDSRSSTPVVTPQPLADGRPYEVVVTGTCSVWRASAMQDACGAPDPAPMFPSAGATNGRAGIDAEFFFGVDRGSSVPCSSLPAHNDNIEMD